MMLETNARDEDDITFAELREAILRRAAAAISLLVGLVLALAAPAAAQPNSGADTTVTGMTSGFWLVAYEHPEREWNNVAVSFVHGFYSGSVIFGGIQCPAGTSPRSLAALTADTVKQRKQAAEDVAFAVMVAATKLNCSVDVNAISRAAELLRQKMGTK
jgi:hypothetical protein